MPDEKRRVIVHKHEYHVKRRRFGGPWPIIGAVLSVLGLVSMVTGAIRLWLFNG